MAKFWQTETAAVVDLTKWVRFTPVRGTTKLRMIIIIPTFSISAPMWLGASYITLEFRANFRENFSIILPVNKPNSSFVLAVRSVRDYIDNMDYFVDRKKFWNITSPIPGELPSWELYNGETICRSFALEIWSVERQSSTFLLEPMILETSVLIPVEDCCDSVQQQIPITEVCELFAPLPLELTQP